MSYAFYCLETMNQEQIDHALEAAENALEEYVQKMTGSCSIQLRK